MTEQEIVRIIESCGVMSAADRDHVNKLCAAANRDLDRWCARRRRRATMRRYAVAVCLAVLVGVVSGRVWARDAVALNVTTTGDATDAQICEKIYHNIERI